MFLQWITNPKKERRERRRSVDLVSEQVKKILAKADQQIILMVRG